MRKGFLVTTSTIADGNMSLRFGEHDGVLGNRRQFLAAHNIEWDQHICMRCNHGEIITMIEPQTVVDENRMLEAEVLVTQTPGLALMLLTADCLPTTLFDPTTNTLALAHFSRETITNGLPLKTIAHLTELGIEAADLLIEVAPYIHAASYCFTEPLPEANALMKDHRYSTPAGTHIDLKGALLEQIATAGADITKTTFSEIDTFTSVNHYSHFASKLEGKVEGRFVTVAMLTD